MTRVKCQHSYYHSSLHIHVSDMCCQAEPPTFAVVRLWFLYYVLAVWVIFSLNFGYSEWDTLLLIVVLVPLSDVCMVSEFGWRMTATIY